MILATKVGAPIGPGPQDRGLSASHILREVDRSLARLQTDVIDVYLVHWPDKLVPLEVTLDAIDKAVRQGKIRYFGASNHSAWRLCKLLWLADRAHLTRVVCSQIPFSLLRREFQQDLPFCDQHEIGVTPYQPLQGGLLTGKYQRGHAPPSDSRAAEMPDWIWKQDDPMFDRLEAIQRLAADSNVPTAQYALAWALTQPAIRSLIVGVKQEAHLRDAVAAAQCVIPAEDAARIDAICPPPWQQPDPVRG